MIDVDALLAMKGIEKGFPGVKALAGVDFDVREGEIHAIVGENGAGKSTLIKVMTGVERPDAGTITLGGTDIHVRSPQHAQSLGISTVYQEVNLCPNLSVGENILIGRAPRRFGMIDSGALHRRAAEILRSLDVEVDVTQPLGSFSVAIQQMAAIARALEISSARILILDEPTSSLDAHETEQLFGVMRKLKRQGLA
ncbi:MAG TPA: ATP-binding cassette domain-containing protein, partial [Candidatus Limnocylindrales bacterium]